MNSRLNAFFFKRQANAIEWKLLIFLILFMDVKLVVKLAAIVMIYILQPDLRFRFSIKNSRLPLFYLLVIAVAILNWFIRGDFSANYSVLVLLGILFWTASILAVHQVKLFVEKTDIAILHNTLFVFFIVNILGSVFNLSAILLEIGFRNPFMYQGDYQKYFVNTGDYIKGITLDSSTTNALINSFGIIYFLYQKKYWPVIACMITLILTASNFTNAILLLVFAGIFLFKSNRDQKNVMAVCMLLLVIFLAKFSPQNDNYINDSFKKYVIREPEKIVPRVKIIPIRERPDSLLDDESRKEKIAVLALDSIERHDLKLAAMDDKGMIQSSVIKLKERPEIPGDSIHTAAFQWRRDTTEYQRQIIAYVNEHDVKSEILNTRYDLNSPGKVFAAKESLNFLKAHPAKLITGDGVGNFSSKLAFRATGLKMAGGYPEKLVYTNKDFLDNHFSLYSYFFTKNASKHSILNSPASVYDQLLTEYGLIGIAAFIIFYAGFFLRKRHQLSYGVPLLVMMLLFFSVDYWFEQLSVVLLFELMMFINIKENIKKVINE